MKLESTNLAKAVAALDFSTGNAELERLRADYAATTDKDGEVRAEIERLSAEIAAYTGPDPEAVTAAILAGETLEAASKASRSKTDLEDRRTALRASLGPLRERAERIRAEIGESEGRLRAVLFDAVIEAIEAHAAQQREAAQAMLEAHAAIEALADLTRRGYLPEVRASRDAIAGLVGNGKLLAWRTQVEVPADLRKALEPLKKVSPVFAHIPERVTIHERITIQ